jgi:hypothetical protein
MFYQAEQAQIPKVPDIGRGAALPLDLPFSDH